MTWPKQDNDHIIVTSAQMEAFEEEIFMKGMPVEALMEKVGLGMRDWILQNHDLLNEGVVFLIGPGHNGGDGLVLARELYLSGVEVSIWCPLTLRKDLTRKHFSYCKWLGIEELTNPPDFLQRALWIDALFGVSQSRPIPKKIELLLKSRQIAQPGRLISLDVPSGICSDTGKLLSEFAATSLFTLTVGLVKQGLLQDIALPFVGQLIRIDIGIPEKLLANKSQPFPLSLSSKDCASLSLPKPQSNLNKYKRGRLLVFAGSDQYRGAAMMSLQGALASGVGSINAVLPKLVADSLWQVAPEVVIAGLSKTSTNGEVLIKESLADLDLSFFDTFMLGPGLGISKEKWLDCQDSLANFLGLLVLDADALNRLAQSTEGWKWMLRRKGPTWITPHMNEFHRLFPELINLPPYEAVTEAARLSKSVVLLKGANSVVADPCGLKWQLTETASYATRAGLGDVLAGFVGGIGAMGVSLGDGLNSQLFASSVFLHAEAAKNCKEGTNASSISSFLAELVRDLQGDKCLQNHI